MCLECAFCWAVARPAQWTRICPGRLLVEVGSFAGESPRVFIEAGLYVHAIDPWDNASRDRLHECATSFNASHRWRFDMSDAERRFDELLNEFPDRLTKRKGYDQQFVDQYDNSSLDAVYLDAVHAYEETVAAIQRWRTKVRTGGLLCGHDYAQWFPGVIRAIGEALRTPNRVFSDSSWISSIDSELIAHSRGERSTIRYRQVELGPQACQGAIEYRELGAGESLDAQVRSSAP